MRFEVAEEGDMINPMQDEVDRVLEEIEAMVAEAEVLRIHNDLVLRHAITLDENPVVVPLESYELLRREVVDITGQRDAPKLHCNCCSRMTSQCESPKRLLCCSDTSEPEAWTTEDYTVALKRQFPAPQD
jgi:hypothetical protein